MNTINVQTYPYPKMTQHGRKQKSKVDPSSHCAFMFSDREFSHQTSSWWSMLETGTLLEPQRSMREWQDLTTAVNQYITNFTREDPFEDQQTTESSAAFI